MSQVSLRHVLKGYIGGGWGTEEPDQVHTVPASVIRGTDLDAVQSGVTSGVPYRWHKASNARSRTLEAGDIVFEVSGGSKDQPVGRSLLLDDARLAKFQGAVIPASFCKRITPIQTSIHPRFLLAHLQLAWADRRIVQWQVQSTGISNFNFEAFLDDFVIELPPLPTQRRIADILSAYDDLIDNCQRRIDILEQMARALYREWFVKFRYPGYESVPLVPSVLGEIPQGWEVRRLVEVCRLTMGQSPKSEFYNEAGDGLPFHQGVTDFGDRYPTDRLFCTAAGRVAEAGDILFSVRAPVGRMNIADKRIMLGRGLSAIRHNQGYQAFLWEQLRSRFIREDMIGNGAIFASVTKDDMSRIELLCPPKSMVDTATKHLDRLHFQVVNLSQQLHLLRRTRDLLLPRLISGQLEVDAA